MSLKTIIQNGLVVLLLVANLSGFAGTVDTCALTKGFFVDYLSRRDAWNEQYAVEVFLRSVGVRFPIEVFDEVIWRSKGGYGFFRHRIDDSFAEWIDPLGFGKTFSVITVKREEDSCFSPILLEFRNNEHAQSQFETLIRGFDWVELDEVFSHGDVSWTKQEVPTFIDLIPRGSVGSDLRMGWLQVMREQYLGRVAPFLKLSRRRLWLSGAPITIDGLRRFSNAETLVLFPGVYSFNSLGLLKLVESVSEVLRGDESVLVLGSGSGFDTIAVITLFDRLGVTDAVVHAVDINPVAVANTQFLVSDARRRGAKGSALAWVSNGFSNIDERQKYDLILLHAPDPMTPLPAWVTDVTRWDREGAFAQQVFQALPNRLRKGGRMLMFVREKYIKGMLPGSLGARPIKLFEDNGVSVGIYEISVKQNEE